MRSAACLAFIVAAACGGPIEDAPDLATTASALSSTPWDLNPPGPTLWGVAIHGNRAAVSSNDRIYIYERYYFFGTWVWLSFVQIQPQTPPVGGAIFGSAIDLWDDKLIVTTSSPQGSIVEIYVRQSDGTWPLEVTFGPGTGTNPNEKASYGTSPRIEGELAVWGQSYANAKRGRVYVARRYGPGAWYEIQTIDGPQSHERQYFGQDLVLQNGILTVGAPDDDYAGHVYVYTSSPLGQFGLEIDIADPTATNGAKFGTRIGFDNTNLVVRSDLSHYVYRRNLQYIPWWAPFPTPVWSGATAWNIDASGELSTYFGKTAIGVDFWRGGLGRVEVYDMTTGGPTLSQTIDAPPGAPKFGQYVDLHDDRLIVGGGYYGQDGGAYVY